MNLIDADFLLAMLYGADFKPMIDRLKGIHTSLIAPVSNKGTLLQFLASNEEIDQVNNNN